MKRTFAVALVFALASLALAEDWPAWRGPTGQGHSTGKNIPLQWSDKQNVKWKIALTDPGNSTPVIWNDKLFLTQANKGGTVRSLFCYAKADGKLLWQKDFTYTDKERNWAGISYTNASAAVDADCVVASFASAGLYCYDQAGTELWKRTDLGPWEHQFGNGASPVLYGDLVIMWCGPNEAKGRNVLLAVNKKTGKTVWEHEEKFGSWSTPLVAKVKGQDQLLLGTSGNVKNAADDKTGSLKGFDPKTGKELWLCRGLNSYVYTSALVGNDIAVGMSGYGGSALAVKLGGSGDITKDRLWLHTKNTQRVGSGVIVGEHCYILDENATPHCYELATGKDLWQGEQRVAAGLTWGFMVHAEGRLYTLMRSGETIVLAANPKFEVLATNTLGKGEQSNSSLAIANGEIFIRTFRGLWCISSAK